jgi:hypothetical protein
MELRVSASLSYPPSLPLHKFISKAKIERHKMMTRMTETEFWRSKK